VGGNLADRPFQGVQRLRGVRTDGFLFDADQALLERLRLAPGFLKRALEARRDLHLFALGGFDAGGDFQALGFRRFQTGGHFQPFAFRRFEAGGDLPPLGVRGFDTGGHLLALALRRVDAGGDMHVLALADVEPADDVAHRAFDPRDGERLTVLGALDAVRQALQRPCHPRHLIGRMVDSLVARLGRDARGLDIIGRGLAEIVLGGCILRPFGHQTRHPFVQR